MDTTSPTSEGHKRSFYQVNAMQKPGTASKKQLQEPIKETINITELQNKRNSKTKEIFLYKVEVQDGASVPLQVYAVAQGMGLPISLRITDGQGPLEII